MTGFEPTLQAAHARLSAVNPAAYARTRNALEGAVTRLSPYLTHGLLSLREVYDAVHARQPLDPQHKFVFELGWRAYYRHVWSHLGDGIHQSLHRGVLPEDAYSAAVPVDVLQARTGIPAIDLAVRELYATGYLHNHARMWLASYLVHLRKVHWHAAAQWMLGHLLDGDLASNHLSWQWVAGTGSNKPYLFNADNVAKYAPAPWHSPGSAIDTGYEALDRIAKSREVLNPDGAATRMAAGMQQPDLLAMPDNQLWGKPDSAMTADRDVWLDHPWSLGTKPTLVPAGGLVVAVSFAESHAQMPWSTQRWAFVRDGLRRKTPHLWWGSVAQIAEALRGARSIGWQPDPHVDPALTQLQVLLCAQQRAPVIRKQSAPTLFEAVDTYCPSFSQWWRKTAIVPPQPL